MRHKLKYGKLNKTASHRMSMLNNMSYALIEHEQINTTLAKAKQLRPYLEKVITKARNALKKDKTIQNNVKKNVLSKLQNNKNAVNKLFSTLGQRYENKPGGYIRIVKTGHRKGDCAPMCYIQLIDHETKST